MVKRRLTSSVIAGCAFALVLATQYARAEATPDALGKSLTPMGAEKAGNAAGTIPAWEGGLTQCPSGHQPGNHYQNPFPDDKPLLTIDAGNMEKYQAHLSPGQMALLKKYPTWKMQVYPTRRTAAFPKLHYDETMANATRAKLVDGGNGVTGTQGGVPFPIPKNGQEAIWNHLLRYRGDTYAMDWSQAAVTRDGAYTPVRFEYEYDFDYGNLVKPKDQRTENRLANFLQTVTAPARLAGQILLIHEPVDQVKEPRQAWTYNPGQRRVRLAPQVAYDNPGTASDGLRTNDDFFMFTGATDRYDWKLLGKQELYVPYNSYKLVGNELKYSDVLQAGHVNPDHARYELHRVWVVEATLKPGQSHIYKKRRFYIDEDSWAILVTDKYDNREELWRVAESHNIQFCDRPMWYNMVEVHSDLQSGRYLAMGLRNEEPKVFEPIKREASDFTPAGLRGIGTR
ncbi:MAG: DUF1329 domain-containing protein [Betaproteobacteria bacterium]|nr:DUF1329 domain-containing protein [Betaproteobacteria bacterium]